MLFDINMAYHFANKFYKLFFKDLLLFDMGKSAIPQMKMIQALVTQFDPEFESILEKS